MRSALTVAGSGVAALTDPREVSRNAPSFYADVAAWLVVAAVGRALEDCGVEVLAAPDEVGAVVVSDICTERTMRAIAAAAATGPLSPLRFAGANPGVLAGLPCIRWRLRGPSLVLASGAPDAVEVARTVARGWLARGHAAYVVVAEHRREDGAETVRATVLGSPA